MLKKLLTKIQTKLDGWLVGPMRRDVPAKADEMRARVVTAALDVIGSFIGKCSSYEVAGWPYREMEKLIELLRKTGLDAGIEDVVIDWTALAKQAAAHEQARAKKRGVVRDATGADWAAAGAAFEREFGFRPSGDAYMNGDVQRRIQITPAPVETDDKPEK